MVNLLSGLKKTGGGRISYVSESVPYSVDKILDIGCSYGWTLESLVGKSNELWGIDMDQEALLQARQSYPNIKFIHQIKNNKQLNHALLCC